jgi:O-antigen ligase
MKPRARALPSMTGGDEGTKFSFGIVCLLVFCFVALSQKIQIGDVAAIAAVVAVLLREKPLSMSRVFIWYAVYLLIGALGLLSTQYYELTKKTELDMLGLVLIAFSLTNLLDRGAEARAFVIGYLALYAAFPVRGLLYNFVFGIDTLGRYAWNFFFSNPNDFAIANFLPMGLCGYLICTHKGVIRSAAMIGIAILIGAVFLTQSRGAMLGIVAATAYLVIGASSKGKTVVWVSSVLVLAALMAPSSVWDRLSSLRGVSVTAGLKLDVKDANAEERWTIMGVGLGIAAKHLPLGTGIGTYAAAHNNATLHREDLKAGARGPRDAHSLYIRSAAETGLLGFVSILFVIVIPILYARRARRLIETNGVGGKISLAVLILESSMIAYAVAGIFNSGERSTFFMLQYMVPIALISALAREHGIKDPTSSAMVISRRARAKPLNPNST